MSGTPTGRLKAMAAAAGLTVEEYSRRVSAGLKRCSACHGWKVAKAEFGHRSDSRDGLEYICGSCRRELRSKRKRGPHQAPRSTARNAKGGYVALHGYRLVFVGYGHHLAASNGYAYEHRVVAEKMLGRRLGDDELVHHIDGDKQNNSPENLRVVRGAAAHGRLHPGPNKKPRLLVSCACGCGQTFINIDKYSRERRYMWGHGGGRAARGKLHVER